MIELYEVPGEDYGRDLVEVIRCERCKFGEPMESSRYLTCQRNYEVVQKDGFCAWAKAKGDTRWRWNLHNQ